MTAMRQAAGPVLAIALEGATAPTHVHLLPSGRFSGAPANTGAGEWTLDDARAVVRASMQDDRALPIDYDHATDYATGPGAGGTAPAAGWISELEVSPNGIWGRVEWTPRGAAAIAAREYRFISPVFLFDARSRQVRAILRAGLTNNPAFKQLTALASGGTTVAASALSVDELAMAKKLGVSAEGFLASKQAIAASDAAMAGNARAAGNGLTLSADERKVAAMIGISDAQYLASKREVG